MFIDATLKIADAQGITVSGASTSYIDTLRTNLSAKNDVTMVITIITAVTASGGATVDFALQDDTSDAFGGAATVVSTGAVAKASLTAGAVLKLKVPHKSIDRYMRAYITIATGPLLTGAWDIDFVVDADQKIV